MHKKLGQSEYCVQANNQILDICILFKILQIIAYILCLWETNKMSTFWNQRRLGTFIPMLQLLKSLGKSCIEDDFSSNSSEIFEINAILETLVINIISTDLSVKIQEKMLFNVFLLNSCLTDSNKIVMMVEIQIQMMLIVMTIIMTMKTVIDNTCSYDVYYK